MAAYAPTTPVATPTTRPLVRTLQVLAAIALSAAITVTVVQLDTGGAVTTDVAPGAADVRFDEVDVLRQLEANGLVAPGSAAEAEATRDLVRRGLIPTGPPVEPVAREDAELQRLQNGGLVPDGAR